MSEQQPPSDPSPTARGGEVAGKVRPEASSRHVHVLTVQELEELNDQCHQELQDTKDQYTQALQKFQADKAALLAEVGQLEAKIVGLEAASGQLEAKIQALESAAAAWRNLLPRWWPF